jgi:hypothetical protein
MARCNGAKLLAWTLAGSLATPAAAFAAEPVPVQRPGGVAPAVDEAGAPTPPPAEAIDVAPAPTDTASDTPTAEAPAAEDIVAPAETEDVALPSAAVAIPKARIRGVVLDTEQSGIGVPDVTIRVACPCLPEPIVMHSDYDGRFELDDLPAGTFTLMLDRGGRRTERIVSVGAGQRVRIQVKVEPPTESVELERREKVERRAAVMLATGAISAIGGFVMVIAAGIEANKPPCMFGLDDCSNAPRPAVAKGMGIGGAVLMAGGAALITFGALSRRRLRAAVAADSQSVGVTLRGRF